MNGAFDLDFSLLRQGDLLGLPLRVRAQVEGLRLRERKNVVEKRVVVPEDHDVADLRLQFLDGEGLVLLPDHEFFRVKGAEREKQKQADWERRGSPHGANSFFVLWVISSPSASTGSATRSHRATAR